MHRPRARARAESPPELAPEPEPQPEPAPEPQPEAADTATAGPDTSSAGGCASSQLPLAWLSVLALGFVRRGRDGAG